MIAKSKFYIVFVVTIVALLVVGSMPTNSLGDEGDALQKTSGLLQHHLNLKQAQLDQPSPDNMARMQAAGLASDDLSTEWVYLHFADEPTSVQLKELQGLGVNTFTDTWIPPVYDHPNGFLLAEMPLDKLKDVVAKEYVVYVDTAEQPRHLMNDEGTIAMGVQPVWDMGYDGAGVTIAVIDSALDVTHPDIAAIENITTVDYSDYPNIDTNVSDYDPHGTHVTGSVLGRGVQNAKYKGAAPGANLVFFKVGCDGGKCANGGTLNSLGIIQATRDAVDKYGADIITMSIGGWSSHQDGTSPGDQAVDYAFSRGAVVFIAAGNEAMDDQHYSGTVSANGSTDFIEIIGHPQYYDAPFRLIWWDGGEQNDLTLEYYDSNFNKLSGNILEQRREVESVRGTESLWSYDSLTTQQSYLKVVNYSNHDQFFHIYSLLPWFVNADPAYTIGSPATADNAIAVGSYVTRVEWTDKDGNAQSYTDPNSNAYSPSTELGQMSTFSSQGPRVDGRQKPDISAPGQGIISPLNSLSKSVLESFMIISDYYYLSQGTSMATPLAAGATALLLQKYPELKGHPEAVRDRLLMTASNDGPQSHSNGYGYLNINDAASDLTDFQPVVALSGISHQGETDTKTFAVDSASQEVIFSLSWPGSNGTNDLDLELMDPNGNMLTAGGTNVVYNKNRYFVSFQIKSPTAGTWQAKIKGTTVMDEQGYMFKVMAKNSNLVLQPHFDKASYSKGEAIQVNATLTNTQPVTNASVTAILGPMATGGLSPAADLTLKLYDDGTHGDGAANDGVYANSWTNTAWDGSYNFQILATGMNNGEKFARQVSSRVQVGTRSIMATLSIDETIFLPVITK